MSVPHGWDTVTVHRPAMVERRGSIVPDWDRESTHEVAGCNMQPASTSRDFEGRAVQADDAWTLYAPPSADIRACDRIGYDGRTFEVDGEPQPRRSPTGRISHLQVALARWRG